MDKPLDIAKLDELLFLRQKAIEESNIPTPPCRICGEGLVFAAADGSGIKYACDKGDHYSQSYYYVPRHDQRKYEFALLEVGDSLLEHAARSLILEMRVRNEGS